MHFVVPCTIIYNSQGRGLPWWSSGLESAIPLQEVWVQSLLREVIPHASRPKEQNIKQKEYCNKFNKDFKNGPY